VGEPTDVIKVEGVGRIVGARDVGVRHPKAAASRPARFGLMSDPGAPARKTGRLRMYRYRGSVPS
jgi:hypothetical protein